MGEMKNSTSRWRGFENLFWGLLILWSGFVSLTLLWNMHRKKQEIFQLAYLEAESAFNKDVVYRKWASMHGGVYVPVTEQTQPNPYLSHIEERNIETPSARKLTLMNPAYMTRQAHEIGAESYGFRGHITSLNPIRAGNAPDSWEKQALEAFEQGAKEATSIEIMDEKKYIRLMRPLITEQTCLGCHEEQGYEFGDIRGGLSISVPMAPLDAISRADTLTLVRGYFVLWFIGMSGIGIGGHHLKRRIREGEQAEEQIENLAKFPSENPSPVMRITKDGVLIYANDASDSLVAEWNCSVGKEVPERWRHVVSDALEQKLPKRVEIEHENKVLELMVVPVMNSNYANLYATDVTEHKQSEEELRKSREDLRHAQTVGNIGSWRLDVQRNELRWSDQNYHLFKIEKGTPLTYETFLSRVHPDDRSYVDAQWKQALQGKPYDVEHRIIVGDNIKWVREKAFLEFDEENVLLAGFGITQDITERKQARIALQEAYEELEARVEERTKELTETVEMLNSEFSERKRLEKEVLTISEEEQRRIGRELHDGLQQELVGMTFNCERLRKNLASKSLPEAREAAMIHTLLKESIEHAREITRMLYPIEVESNELSLALEQLAIRVEHLFGIVCMFECKETIAVQNSEVAVNLYRIVQEAITNAVKHGKADTISITLQANKEELMLTVKDDGVGLKADYKKTKGMGLRIMKYRASVIGASLDIASNAEGPGMYIRCSLKTVDNKQS